MIGEEYIWDTVDDMVKVRIILPDEDIYYTPGVFATVLNEIAAHKVSIWEGHTLQSDYGIYVSREDGVKVHQILENLKDRALVLGEL